MEWYIMEDKLPNWTDVAQTVIGTLGIAATVITLWKLMKRDKERESEIASLSSIASQLKDMMALNESRYMDSKMPHLEIDCRFDNNLKSYILFFKNLNLNSRITSYNKNDSRGFKTYMATKVHEKSGSQVFSFTIETPDQEQFFMNMSYTIDEKFHFGQNLQIHMANEKFTVSPSVITLLN